MKRLRSPWKTELVGTWKYMTKSIQHGIKGCPESAIVENRYKYGITVYPWHCHTQKDGCGRYYTDDEMEKLRNAH